MKGEPETLTVKFDFSGSSVQADCLDVLVAFPRFVEEMRRTHDESKFPEIVTADVIEAFARLDAASGESRGVAAVATDHFYREIAKLSMLDRYTRAYVSKPIRQLFRELSARRMVTLYILDNTLREDRFKCAVELLESAGVSVVSPRIHGPDWSSLSARVRLSIANSLHVAYIEPDADVNFIEDAKALARELPCVATFRNLAPEEPACALLNFGAGASQ